MSDSELKPDLDPEVERMRAMLHNRIDLSLKTVAEARTLLTKLDQDQRERDEAKKLRAL